MTKRPKSNKSWREKLENPPAGLPKVVRLNDRQRKRFGCNKLLVPTPLLVDAQIRKVRKKKLITVSRIRQRLAEDFKADSTCPLTTGIFIHIVANAAQEDMRKGIKRVTPYWRVIKADGSLNPKLPGGVEAQAALLRAEGHYIDNGRGNHQPKVRDFEKSLV